jgi:hypothetical protein
MQKILGTFLIVVGLLGTVAGPVGAIIARRAAVELSDTVGAALDVTASGLVALEETVVAASGTLTQAADSMDEVAVTILVSSASIEDSQGILRQVAEISGEELPEAIDSFRSSMPALIRVASAIDSTLRAISFVTPGGYDPEVPFDTAIRAIDTSLAEMRPSLVAQADLIREASEGVDGVTEQLGATSGGLIELRDALRSSASVLKVNVATIRRTRASIAIARTDLSGQMSTVGAGLMLAGVFFAVSQMAVAVVGLALVRGELLTTNRPSDEQSDESSTKVPPEETVPEVQA